MSGLWQDLVGRGGKFEMFALLWCIGQLRLFCALVRLVGAHYPAKVNDGGTLVWHGDSTISAMRSLLKGDINSRSLSVVLTSKALKSSICLPACGQERLLGSRCCF